MTTEEIRKAAAVVRDEETANANTATRVGGVLVDLCDAIDVASGEAADANGATNQVVAAHTQYIDVLKPWLRVRWVTLPRVRLLIFTWTD